MSTPWTTAVADLRTSLSDNATDKLRWRKRVFGQTDGSNLNFKTFEARRISPFVSPVSPVGVYVNNAIATVSAEDLPSGAFTLSVAPAEGSTVEATYYYQWFLDAQLSRFLSLAAQWLVIVDFSSIPDGLQPAATDFARGEAYGELAVRWTLKLADVYQAEEVASDAKMSNPFLALQSAFKKSATTLRNQNYQGRGDEESANSESIPGTVFDVAPNR